MKNLAVVNVLLMSVISIVLLVLVGITAVFFAKDDAAANRDFEAAERALAMHRHPSTGPHADPYDWEEKGGL